MEERGKIAMEISQQPEDMDGDIVEFEVVREDFEQALVPFMLSTLTTWGLSCGQETPNVEAIRSVMTDRYGWTEDDVPHEDPFSPPQELKPDAES